MGFQEGLHLRFEFRVVAAKTGRDLVVLRIGMLAHGQKDFFDFLVSLGSHAHRYILPAQFPHQPGSCHRPIPLDGALGNSKGLRHFLDAHAREKPHFHDLGLTGIELGQLFHRLVEGENLLAALGGQCDRFIEFHALGAPPRFCRFLCRA